MKKYSEIKYGCMGCEAHSDNLKDFQKVKNDPYHYCKDCIKKFNLVIMENKK